MYYGAKVNYFAGIGHQMANWIDGLHWAKEFGLKHVNFPFSNPRWENLLGIGFSHGEATIKELKQKGYKIRRLPPFDENNPDQISFVRKIISTYIGEKVAFWPPQDHFYRNMYGIGSELRRRWDASPARKNDNIIYKRDQFNVAIHVRRTVIIDGQVIVEEGENKAKRWLANDYYEKVLKQVLESIKPDKPIAIYIFSLVSQKNLLNLRNMVRCISALTWMNICHLLILFMLIY